MKNFLNALCTNGTGRSYYLSLSSRVVLAFVTMLFGMSSSANINIMEGPSQKLDFKEVMFISPINISQDYENSPRIFSSSTLSYSHDVDVMNLSKLNVNLGWKLSKFNINTSDISLDIGLESEDSGYSFGVGYNIQPAIRNFLINIEKSSFNSPFCISCVSIPDATPLTKGINSLANIIKKPSNKSDSNYDKIMKKIVVFYKGSFIDGALNTHISVANYLKSICGAAKYGFGEQENLLLEDLSISGSFSVERNDSTKTQFEIAGEKKYRSWTPIISTIFTSEADKVSFKYVRGALQYMQGDNSLYADIKKGDLGDGDATRIEIGSDHKVSKELSFSSGFGIISKGSNARDYTLNLGISIIL